MQVLKKVRNIICFMGVLFCWGIAGSIELERITLSEGVGYIMVAAFVVLGAAVLEFAANLVRVLVIRYAKRRVLRRKMLHKVKAY